MGGPEPVLAPVPHSNLADLSVYVARESRGTGVGYTLLDRLADEAKRSGFHKSCFTP